MVDSYIEPLSVITMPKSKPSQVIVHRIELQEKERDALEALVAGQTLKNVVIPVAVVGAVGAGTYLGYKTLKEVYNLADGWVEEIQNVVVDVNNPTDDWELKDFAFAPISVPRKISYKFVKWWTGK